jgi:cyclohexa-1,5-dienecarbonyl-CoA hydratase
MNMETEATDTLKTIALEYTHGRAVARIELNGGKGNVLTGEMMRELRSALAMAGAERDLKIVVITGSGRHFSFGASVEEHRREHAAAMLREFHGLIMQVARFDIPVLSAVSGLCLGGAMELALAGNLIFADQSASFGQPEITLGVFAPPASLLLPLRVGFSRAEELLITGESFSAARAAQIGIVHRLFDTPEGLREGTEAWIEQHIIPKSASSLRLAIHAERLVMVELLATTLPRLEHMYIKQLMATSDANEGIQAFLDKRTPIWVNG